MSRIEELEKRLAADPNSRIFVQLAEEYRKQGLLENAIEICESGLEKHPQYPSARVALGRALLEAETFDRASEQFEAVLAQIPDNILANKFLGETYHRLGRYDEAIQKYQIAQTLAPEDTELEGKIQAVEAEMAGDGPAPLAAPDPADETAAADPNEYRSPPPPVAPAPVPAGGDAPLEPTLVDAHATAGPTSPPSQPAAEGAPPAPPEPAAPAEVAAPEEDLAPIPLVDVDEPMVLESASYTPPSENVASPAPPEPVPVLPPSEPPPQPPAMEPPPSQPTTFDPPPVEVPPMEPPPVDPAGFEPPPMEPAPMEPPPMEPATFDPPPMEPAPLEPPPVEPAPLEPPPMEPAPPMVDAAPMEVSETVFAEATPMVDAQPPAVGPSPDAAPAGEIETPTMAELYASQGHFDKAVAVYRNLLARDPNETQYLERIEELEMLAKASADAIVASPSVDSPTEGVAEPGRQRTIDVLEQWLDGIRRSRRA